MRLLVNSKITADMLTVTGVTLAFPKENLLSDSLVEKTYFEDYIDIDFGARVQIDAIGLVRDSSSTIKIQANNSASWGAPPLNQIITDPVTFISEKYRYWRLLLLGVISPGTPYTTGTQQNLNNPDDNNNSQSSFIPVTGDFLINEGVSLYVGDYKWTITGEDLEGTNASWVGDGIGSSYGSVYFKVNSTGAFIWNNFAPASMDGVKTFTFNGSEGSFQYRYVYEAWFNALNGTNHTIVFDEDGNVYKNSVLAANMINDINGAIGPAGGRSVTSDRVGYFYLGEYMQLPYPEPGSTPNHPTNDKTATSSGFQKQKTRGTTAKTQSFDFYATTQTEYELFRDWWNSDDRSNLHFFIQFEDDGVDTHFPPYFADVTEFKTDPRSYLAYTWSISLEEGK